MKPTLDINVNLSTRKAILYPSSWHYNRLGLDQGVPVEVGVFGLFQCSENGESCPHFVVELPDGRCTYAQVDDIQFIKEEETTDELNDCN